MAQKKKIGAARVAIIGTHFNGIGRDRDSRVGEVGEFGVGGGDEIGFGQNERAGNILRSARQSRGADADAIDARDKIIQPRKIQRRPLRAVAVRG